MIVHTATRLSILYTRFNLSIKLLSHFCILVPRFCQVVRGTNLPRRKLQSVVGRRVFRRRSRHPSSPSLYPWRLRLRASTLLKASRNWGPELRTALNFRRGFREREREREIDVVERQDNVLNNPSALPSVRRAMWIARLYNCESKQRPAAGRQRRNGCVGVINVFIIVGVQLEVGLLLPRPLAHLVVDLPRERRATHYCTCEKP